MTRLVIALGGNALIRRGEPGSTDVQRRNLVAAARGLVTLAEGSKAEIVITHGNGPQVGFLAIEPRWPRPSFRRRRWTFWARKRKVR